MHRQPRRQVDVARRCAVAQVAAVCTQPAGTRLADVVGAWLQPTKLWLAAPAVVVKAKLPSCGLLKAKLPSPPMRLLFHDDGVLLQVDEDADHRLARAPG